MRVDVATSVPLSSLAAALLDRNGKPLAVPVALADRDRNGVRYVTAEIALSPLAPGDYLIEVTAQTGATPERALVAIRIVP